MKGTDFYASVTNDLVNGSESPFTAEKIADSDYVNITVTANGKTSFEILFS